MPRPRARKSLHQRGKKERNKASSKRELVIAFFPRPFMSFKHSCDACGASDCDVWKGRKRGRGQNTGKRICWRRKLVSIIECLGRGSVFSTILPKERPKMNILSLLISSLVNKCLRQLSASKISPFSVAHNQRWKERSHRNGSHLPMS